MALRLDRARPAAERGPVLRAALRRLASSFRSLIVGLGGQSLPLARIGRLGINDLTASLARERALPMSAQLADDHITPTLGRDNQSLQSFNIAEAMRKGFPFGRRGAEAVFGQYGGDLSL